MTSGTYYLILIAGLFERGYSICPALRIYDQLEISLILIISLLDRGYSLCPALRIYDQRNIFLNSNNKFARTRVRSVSSTPNLWAVYYLILITCFFDRAHNLTPALRIYDQQDLFHSSNNKFAWKSIRSFFSTPNLWSIYSTILVTSFLETA
jgi:hypothetical protein